MEEVLAALAAHESRSQARFEELRKEVSSSRTSESNMEGINSERVTVNAGGGSDGGSNAALIAALSGRRGDDGFGGGMGGILIGALLGGGLFGRDGRREGGAVGECASKSDILMNKLGDIQAAVPLAEAQVQLAIAGSTASVKEGQTTLMQQINGTNIAMLAGFNNLSQYIGNEGDKTRAVVNFQGDRIVALVNDVNRENLNREITNLNAALVESRSNHNGHLRSRETEVNVTQNVNQQQAQVQLNSRLETLQDLVQRVVIDNQVIRAQNSAINIGGLQSASPTNTNTQVR